MTKGEQMLLDLGYEKTKGLVFVNDKNTIVFDYDKKVYGCYTKSFENITMTVDLHLAISQVLIDYGFINDEDNDYEFINYENNDTDRLDELMVKYSKFVNDKYGAITNYYGNGIFTCTWMSCNDCIFYNYGTCVTNNGIKKMLKKLEAWNNKMEE